MTTRSSLPVKRRSETFTVWLGVEPYIVTCGFYPDGRLGEVFVSGSKSGFATETVARDGAVVLSIALQYGAPIEVIAGAITRDDLGEPTSIIGEVLDKIMELRKEDAAKESPS